MTPPESSRKTPHLTELFRRGASLRDAFEGLGTVHCPQSPTLRHGWVGSQEGMVYPHPSELRFLLNLLFTRLERNCDSTLDAEDDFYNAALCAYGISTLHPFEDGNGRVAVDLAGYFLMLRRKSATPVIDLPPDAHRIMGRVFATMNPRAELDSAESLWALRETVARRIGAANPHALRHAPAFFALSRWLQAARLHPTPSLHQDWSTFS